ncbi:MAG: hypothetical protein JSV51_05555 [Candidatus Bathyarchaeota archaeon]|nr:MAG: hypothetical protein JSV51_05555 [Candidatus Bathyarchaeota archaeon]
MSSKREENWFGLLSFGFFIMVFALFFIIVPNYGQEVVDFFGDFELQETAPLIFLPAPQQHHPVVYETIAKFCLIFGLFQIVIVVLRFALKSSLSRIAETISNIFLWLGAAYMFNLLFLEVVEWFPFIGGIIAVAGFSLIARSSATLLFSWIRRY